ncbi:hypothetical protein [Pseudoduganella violaceinigra]|uniref:hypothetical protein n=1 Tax=Pseudoduganella violaceinigra TaxID=246602 RepID=UPI0003FFA53B|nr:hypothetical protein [Pseudoduganella violaceinigra]
MLNWKCRITFSLLALAATSALAVGAPYDESYDHKSSGPAVILPAGADSAADRDALAVHLAGREYRSGSGWWALRCNDACELIPLSVTVTSKDHERYDDTPMPGQLLQFSPRLPADGVIAVFKPFRAPLDKLQLKAGPVTSWIPGRECKPKKGIRHQGGDVMGGELSLPAGGKLRFVPRLDQPVKAAGADAALPPSVWLELQSGAKRQRIAEFQFDIMWGEGSAMGTDSYVRLVGDLDNDGKPDFIIDTGAVRKDLTLYLSSLAGPDEIVGMAGSFSYLAPNDPGC